MTLEGGCQVPAGVFTVINKNDTNMELNGFISSLDGTKFIRDTDSGSIDNTKNMAKALAQRLLDAGGREILEQIHLGVD